MKKLQVSYTILHEVEVPDDVTTEEIEDLVEENASECGLYPFCNDIEYEVVNA